MHVVRCMEDIKLINLRTLDERRATAWKIPIPLLPCMMTNDLQCVLLYEWYHSLYPCTCVRIILRQPCVCDKYDQSVIFQPTRTLHICKCWKTDKIVLGIEYFKTIPNTGIHLKSTLTVKWLVWWCPWNTTSNQWSLTIKLFIQQNQSRDIWSLGTSYYSKFE